MQAQEKFLLIRSAGSLLTEILFRQILNVFRIKLPVQKRGTGSLLEAGPLNPRILFGTALQTHIHRDRPLRDLRGFFFLYLVEFVSCLAFAVPCSVALSRRSPGIYS